MEPLGHSAADHYEHRRRELQHGRTSAAMTQVGKKHKSQALEGTRGKLFDVTSEDLWNLHKILHSKKGSLGKTYKSNPEANAKVYDPNQKTITPACLHETCEKVGKKLGEADELFDKDFEMMRKAMLKVKDAQRYAEIAQEQVYDRREAYHPLLKSTLLPRNTYMGE